MAFRSINACLLAEVQLVATSQPHAGITSPNSSAIPETKQSVSWLPNVGVDEITEEEDDGQTESKDYPR
jgi:hypothetical protein